MLQAQKRTVPNFTACLPSISTIHIICGRFCGKGMWLISWLLGDLKKGEKLFTTRCAQCHTLKDGEGNKVGPALHGLFGRKTGSVDGYAYTDANKQKGIEWNEDTLVCLHLRTFWYPIVLQSLLTCMLVHIPGEPQEVHSRYQNGFRWPQEGEGPQ